ncbi:Dihydrolipoyllysine-residue (2-methylpropanoyl)transferase [Lentibacillus sp. JNUCC-1]|uniref:dihydrolipoamide acetyltransferase family protein n=1 Tax=Lentibacillus sp. JNUCC-1 TaxID=2654513 RepID=UPI0012E860E3|nr:dihydrolipoamide acetyltransferase family protein [Lentibacillus sp. JNUCC-1]MUV39698.1 Dihydrolipoyllysine-residue (2-methylpropanoyl)transferase [Lentibacillus sp. JNUCC-1]
MTIEKINMPQLGESVTEGTISTWLVKEGDHVNKYDPIAEVMTDKVNAEVPSSFSGVIKDIIAQEGDTLEVGSLMCHIEIEGAAERPEESDSDSQSKSNQEGSAEPSDQSSDQSMKKRYSPAVLRLSQEHGINLEEVSGTGRGGRITRKDIEAVIAQGGKASADTQKQEVKPEQEMPSASTESAPKPTAVPVDSQAGDVEIPVKGVRKMIADNMVKSKTEIPHAWMTVEVDVTNLVALRNQVKNEFKQNEGYSLTYFAFFVKAVAQALKEYPILNSTWAGDRIIKKKDINISIAVAKDDELFVPVIKQADELTVKGIARNIYELAQKARNGKLTAEDMQGGTFTVNNTGSFGSVSSMGVINHPQAAILQVESIVKRPVIINDMFAARDMVNLSLSLDHRVLDGLVCGRFLNRVKNILEEMNAQTTSIY